MNELDIWARIFGTDKRTNDAGENIFHDYTTIYYPYLLPLKNEPINLLEIGVWKGYSHRMWEMFFPNGIIYGIDDYKEPTCTPKEEIETNRIKIFVGNQSDEQFLKDCFNNIELDVIIDDGSHNSWDIQKTFKYLWSNLKSGGIYFIEDLAVCHIRKFREFDDWRSSTIAWLESMFEKPFSYYIERKELEEIAKQIKTIKIIGELGIITKI